MLLTRPNIINKYLCIIKNNTYVNIRIMYVRMGESWVAFPT